ncbi:MAG: DUF4397 domain-containing protein [Gemmatimonas sp.]
MIDLSITEWYMRRIARAVGFGTFALASIAGCESEKMFVTETVPTAGVRFINAVPDTAGAFGLDMRFVDIVENSAHFRVNFRNGPITTAGVTGAAVQYKPARAGSRHFTIFLDDTIQSIATVKLRDTTVSLTAGTNYTAILWGGARSGVSPAMRLTFFPEVIPDPGAQVALRVINATGSPIDVRQYVSTGTAPDGATWANVPPLSASGYVLVAPNQIRYNVQPAGGGTALFADMLALIGAPERSTAGAGGKIDTDALPGTTIAGSAISLIVFPRSTAGARTPQATAFTVPAGAFIWDRRPPRSY